MWVDWAILIAATALFSVAVGLLVVMRKTASSVLLASWLISWALLAGWTAGIVVWEPLARFDGSGQGMFLGLWFTSTAVGLAFILMYPNLGITRLRAASLTVIGLLVVGMWTAVLVTPWTYEAMYDLWILNWVTLLVGDVLGIVLLGTRWLRGRAEAFRMQVTWALLAWSFWNYHDNTTSNVYRLLQRDVTLGWTTVSGDPLSVVLWSLALLSVLLTGAIAVTAIVRHLRRRGDAADRIVALLTPFLLAATTLQYFGPPKMHILIDFIPAALVIYAVARADIVDIDIRLKAGLRRGMIGAAFIAVFFVVSESAAAFFEGVAGSAFAGILGAGLLVLFLAPLQQLAERVSQRALPNVEDTDGYRNYRRFQIYRVALEGAFRDGVVNVKETQSLASLRHHLGLSDEDHERLEHEILEAFMPGGATPGPVASR